MIELVGAIVLIGILSLVVIPRFMGRQTFDSRGFYDQTVAVLRYAQKAAIAQRRNVCVAFGSASIALNVANAAGSGVSCTAANIRSLGGPDGTSPYAITAPSGINFTNTVGDAATPNDFFFDALGRASAGQTFRVSGLSENITVEQDTGYVHP